jgi:hypothetical protein
VDTGITRELVRASSASCLDIAAQCRAENSAGSPPRDQSSPPERPAAPPGRSIHPKMRRRQVQRDKREREGTPEGREAVFADHSSEGSNASHYRRKRAGSWAPPA